SVGKIISSFSLQFSLELNVDVKPVLFHGGERGVLDTVIVTGTVAVLRVARRKILVNDPQVATEHAQRDVCHRDAAKQVFRQRIAQRNFPEFDERCVVHQAGIGQIAARLGTTTVISLRVGVVAGICIDGIRRAVCEDAGYENTTTFSYRASLRKTSVVKSGSLGIKTGCTAEAQVIADYIATLLYIDQEAERKILVREGVVNARSPIRLNVTNDLGRGSRRQILTVGANDAATVFMIDVVGAGNGTIRLTLSGIDRSRPCREDQQVLSVFIQGDNRILVPCPVRIDSPREIALLYRVAKQAQFNTFVLHFTCVDILVIVASSL